MSPQQSTIYGNWKESINVNVNYVLEVVAPKVVVSCAKMSFKRVLESLKRMCANFTPNFKLVPLVGEQLAHQHNFCQIIIIIVW